MQVLMLLVGNVFKDARVSKEIESLKTLGYKITLIQLPSFKFKSIKNFKHGDLKSISLFLRFLPKNYIFWPLKYFEMVLKFFFHGLRVRPKIVHCHDLLPLIPAYMISIVHKCPLIYDSHEIASEMGKSLKPKKFWLFVERFISKKASKVIVTDKYRLNIISKILKIDNKQKMHIISNFPKMVSIQSNGKNIRSLFGDKKIIVSTGYMIPGRYQEEIIKSLAYLPDVFQIVFIGFCEEGYKAKLKDISFKLGVQNSFSILNPLPFDKLIPFISGADCSLVFYNKLTKNNFYCSPNKLFEALMAGLPILGTNNPLIDEIIKSNDLGETIDIVNPLAISKSIERIVNNHKLNQIRKNARKLAMNHYHWELQEQKLMDIYRSL